MRIQELRYGSVTINHRLTSISHRCLLDNGWGINYLDDARCNRRLFRIPYVRLQLRAWFAACALSNRQRRHNTEWHVACIPLHCFDTTLPVQFYVDIPGFITNSIPNANKRQNTIHSSFSVCRQEFEVSFQT